MAAPLRLASWIRFETVMNQQDWRTAIEQLVPHIHLPDPELLDLLRSCVPEQGISSMAQAQALLLCNFRVGSSKPNTCEQWLTEVTRDLFKPIPFREVFVILALFLPQLTFAEGAKLDFKLWYSLTISNELSTIHVTPIAQGLQGMHEYKIAFTPNSRAAAFVSPEQPGIPGYAALRANPQGSQVGRGIPTGASRRQPSLCTFGGAARICHSTQEEVFFFPRVRTPCGHGAQVIVEGREEQTDGGERNEGPKTNPNQTPKPAGRNSTIL